MSLLCHQVATYSYRIVILHIFSHGQNPDYSVLPYRPNFDHADKPVSQ
jgi:hypothetical protein